jgi:hypothetical protein
MDMMSMFMMSSMMGGQNPFGNMFGATPQPAAQPATEPAKPSADEALNIILKNPDALAKLKDALKAE